MSALRKFYIDTPQEHFELLHTPNQQGVAVVWEREGLGKRWHKLRPDDAHMPALLRTQQGAQDSFITVNEFLYWRQVDNLKSLRALYCDIDRRMHVDELEGVLSEAHLPWPNLVVESGRGLHLYWLHEPVPAKALPAWQRAQDYIVKSLAAEGADQSAKDCARVLRLCGTINAKNSAVVRGQVYDPTPWNFHGLCNEILGYRPEYQPRVAKVRDFAIAKANRGQRVRPVNGSIYSWWGLVYEDLRAIAQQHWFGGIPEGHRNNFLFLTSVALSWFAHAETLESELTHLAMTWTPGLKASEVRDAIMPAVRKARLAADKQKVVWEGQERDPRYWYRRDTLHQMMEPLIPPELAPNLRAIVSSEILEQHRQERELKRDRIAEGRHTMTREEYLALESIEKAEPWETLGISRRTYYDRKKAGKL